MADYNFLDEIDTRISSPNINDHKKAVYIHEDQLNIEKWPDWINEQKPLLIFIESASRETELPYHKKRLTYLLSAMRHFAIECHESGFPVLYKRVESTADQKLAEILDEHAIQLTYMTPSEWAPRERLRELTDSNENITEIENSFFLADADKWIDNIEPGYRMEYFYRDMRRQTGYLMDDDEPEGGDWNYDEENREPLPGDCNIPEITAFEPDEITREVMELIRDQYDSHFGSLESFDYAVTREQALQLLDEFIEDRLTYFGPYEDAMATDEQTIFHSQLSPYLNNGLLLPEEICERAIDAYQADEAPINSVEGLVRQIIGWREYVKIYYEAMMPNVRDTNAMDFDGDLPEFYWNGETDMHCLQESTKPVINDGYAHHIQRLMVLSNFSNLSNTDPRKLNHWFRTAFVDAFEWVVLPNVLGMSTFADGGVMASKPYVSSGNYINKMSDYCKDCTYNVDNKTGENACPFNYLYWNFVDEQREFFEQSGRNSFMVNMFENKSDEDKEEIKNSTNRFLNSLEKQEYDS